MPELALTPKNHGFAEQIVEITLHEDVSVQIDAAMFDQLLQSHHVGAVGDMGQRIAENFPRRRYLDQGYKIAAQGPPGTGGFVLIIEEYPLGADMGDRALEADIMHEAPRLATKIGSHAECIV